MTDFDSVNGVIICILVWIIFKINCKCGYHQIRTGKEMNGELRSKCNDAFHGWLVMHFGLPNPANTFMRFMCQLLQPLMGKLLAKYFDNNLICIKLWEQHFRSFKQAQTAFAKKKKIRTNYEHCGHFKAVILIYLSPFQC